MRTVTTIEVEGQSGVTPDSEYWGENYILENENQFTTTEYFWDCECGTDYIPPKKRFGLSTMWSVSGRKARLANE